MIGKDKSREKTSLQQQYQSLLNSQKKYPVGPRNQVLARMTSIPEKAIIDFNKCRTWKDVWNFHKTHTQWLEDTQINEYIKLYKMEAQTRYQKGTLPQQREWMLNDV